MVAVSVVVPVYNPGDRIQAVLDSLDAQTMRDFEVVFVDDGSTDDSPQTLAQYAASRSNVRVTRIANSGWPGRPRNVGTDLAGGEYVLYMDHDDGLPPDSLERWYGYAAANDSDICVGKESRPGGMSAGLTEFRSDRPHAEMVRDNLADLWTPHKLYRRGFLLDNDLRFPEGPTRLEDHHLNIRAFRRAERISLLSSHVVYRWNSPREVTHSSSFDSLDIYWSALHRLVDLVEEEWPEGPERDAILLRWWGRKILKRASAPRFSGWSAAYRSRLFPYLREIDGRFPERLQASLPPVRRLQSQLLRGGDESGLMAIARTQSGIDAEAAVTSIRWASGVLEIEVEVRAVTADGPLATSKGSGGDIVWDPDAARGMPGRADLRTDLVEELRGALVLAVLRDLPAQEDWPLPTWSEPSVRRLEDGRLAAVLAVRTRIDPRTARSGRALGDGRHEVVLAMDWFGRRARARLQADVSRLGAVVDGQQVRPYRSRRGTLRLLAGEQGAPVWRQAVADIGGAVVALSNGMVEVTVPLSGLEVAGPGHRTVDLLVGRQGVVGQLEVGAGCGQLAFRVPRRGLTSQLFRYPDARIPVRWAIEAVGAGSVMSLRLSPRGVAAAPPGERFPRLSRGRRPG